MEKDKVQINDGTVQKSLYTEEVKQTEINILHAVVVGKLDFSTTQQRIKSTDFYSEDHQKIFQAFENLYRNHEPIDLITVSKELESVKRTNGWEWTHYLLSLDDNAFPTGTINLEYHVRQINKFSQQRKLWRDAHNLANAVETNNTDKIVKLKAEISDFNIDVDKDEVILLADQEITPRAWLLEDAIPDYYPTIIYGAGGLGKSFLGLYLGILACLGEQTFLNKKLPLEPRNVLYIDYELQGSEQVRRAQQIIKGLNLSHIPNNLHYYEPKSGLSKIFPTLKQIIKSKEIGFIILDSLGASGTDGESVQDIVNLFTKLRDLKIPTLILDHQSKTQMGEKYENKTPFGTVYKGNLARSVFQLAKRESKNNQITLQLQHTKANFGKLLDNLIFDIHFEGDRVLFTESRYKTQDKIDTEILEETIKKLTEEGEKVNQITIQEILKGQISKDKVKKLLEREEGKLWVSQRGNRKEKIYIPKNLKNGDISNQTFGFLQKDLDDYAIPEELLEENPDIG